MSGAGCQLSTVPAHVGCTGTARTAPHPGVLPGALPHEDVMLFHCVGLGHLVWEGQRGAFPAERLSRSDPDTRGARCSQPPFLLPPGNQSGGIFHIWQ